MIVIPDLIGDLMPALVIVIPDLIGDLQNKHQ